MRYRQRYVINTQSEPQPSPQPTTDNHHNHEKPQPQPPPPPQLPPTTRHNHNHHNQDRLRSRVFFFRVAPWMSLACSPLLVLQGDGKSDGCGCTGVMSSCRSVWPWLQRRTTARSPGQRREWRARRTTRHGDRSLHSRGRGRAPLEDVAEPQVRAATVGYVAARRCSSPRCAVVGWRRRHRRHLGPLPP